MALVGAKREDAGTITWNLDAASVLYRVVRPNREEHMVTPRPLLRTGMAAMQLLQRRFERAFCMKELVP